MPTVVRTLTPADVPSAMELSKAANWNQTPEDWLRVLQLARRDIRCVEAAGKIVATASLLPYGTRLAWIGMVLTRPEYRRQGYARELMEDLIARAEGNKIRTLKLDATHEGRPLYESLGFVVEETVERWGRSANVVAAQDDVDNARMPEELFAMDEAAFGVSRRDLLEMLLESGRCNSTPHGYVLSRPGATARYLGPCVAASETEAGLLIATHLENDSIAKSSDWYWDLLPANTGAVRCAEQLGFTRRRTLWRMSRGETIEDNNAMVYAIAGFELG